MDKDRLRLVKLIEHWIEHNDQHRVRYEESAKEALEMGLSEVAEELKLASEAGERVSVRLRIALEKIG